jgi:hypothetical protein
VANFFAGIPNMTRSNIKKEERKTKFYLLEKKDEKTPIIYYL